MLATIISDKFSNNDRIEIANALDDLCSSDDNWGWASTGIYCFWDSITSHILYIGLAKDLPRRFREHTGLSASHPNGCKKLQIDNHFLTQEQLGFSVLLQSPLDQAGQSPFSVLFPELGDVGVENIKTNEGLLLEAYRIQYGELPSWNKIGGSTHGASLATVDHEPLLKHLSDINQPSPYRAELTLRELADDKNIMAVTEEVELHLIRMFALSNAPLQKALEIHQKMQQFNPSSHQVLERPNCKAWISKWCF